MGEADVKVTGRMALQRLDLVQVAPGGKVGVKKGKSCIVCPELPQADAGCAGLAGIYVAPWKAAANPNYDAAGGLKTPSPYAVTEHEILPIHPAPPVEPVNKSAVERSLKKLADGRELKIAFMGASVTLGAEAGAWWDDLWTEKNLGYPSRVVVALRRKFPRAAVAPIAAFQGGTQTKYGLEMIDKTVVPAKADLLLVDFGGNDVSGPIGKGPNNPPEQFKEDMRTIIRRAKAAGMETIIVIGERSNPWLKPDVLQRWPAYRQAMLDLAKEENVGAADVYTEFANQASRGIPPFSQLHNWINHPGKNGHKLYADVILRFFD
jgi:lysophospholipase L1-like esterase